MWAVSYAGGVTRTRNVGAPQLCTSGPYAFVRNPLYVGNMMMYLGIVFIAGAANVYLMAATTVGFFLIQYSLIISLEEETLKGLFGNSYEEYNDDTIKDHFYSFFERERTDNGYVDEDETFCKRWSKCKGQMWVNLMFNLNTSFYNTNVGSLYLSSVN